jgi:uncharacterized glyoxalase superfamily protein PhnB
MSRTATAIATVYPFFGYRDAAAALEWLERAFGFRPGAVMNGDDGSVSHAELWHGPGGVMLGSETGAAGDLGDGTYVVVPASEVDGLYERARGAGADVVRELGDTSYGSRDFIVRDPEGKLWAFGTYRPDGAG